MEAIEFTGPTSPTRAERRRFDSRARLLSAARRLFVERGYHGTRSQDVARAAGVGHGTFYLHFSDKQECFLAFVEDAHHELERELAARIPPDADLEGRIRALLFAVHAFDRRNPGVLAAAMSDLGVIAAREAPRESLVDRWAREWASALTSAMTLGTVRDDYDPLLVGHAIVGLLQGATRGGHAQRIGRTQVIENLTRFLVRALLPPGHERPRRTP
ncbi:MAG: TetR/AcrR family transcriptional regulator [Myxococcota bacterium]